MNIDKSKITTYYSVLAVLLREVRVKRGLHTAQFADCFAKQASAWEDIESGKHRLDLDVLMRVCNGLAHPLGQLIQSADAHANYLRLFGWTVVLSDLGGAKNDGLLESAKKYWGSPGGMSQDGLIPLVNPYVATVPFFNGVWQAVEGVFAYAVDEQFRAHQDNAENFKPPVFESLTVAAQGETEGI
ncbi:helix-turn-helix domain-containing protein, partial [Burkholderia gladioli]